MAKIKTLIDIEEILLNADNEFRYEYSLDDLIKSEKYLKEIGSITNLFFSVQVEYGKLNEPKDDESKQKIVDYHNKLADDELNVDVTKYLKFIEKLKPLISGKKYARNLEELLKNS